MVQIKEKATIGRVELVTFPGLIDEKIHARIDTGAKKSAIWASKAEVVDGVLRVIFFDKGIVGYTGDVVTFDEYGSTVIASSNGHTEQRYTIKLTVRVGGRRIKATFTLADRSTQVYPILIGRNVLHKKFIVDVQLGQPLASKEKARSDELKETLTKEEIV